MTSLDERPDPTAAVDPARRPWTRRIVGAVVMVVALVLAVVIVTRCAAPDAGAPSDIVVTDAYVAETPLRFAAAVYLTIEQRGGDDRLVGAASPVAGRVSLHEMEPMPGGGLMLSTDAIDIGAGSTVALEPFGSHVMLEQLVEPLTAGSTVPVTLRFERSAPIEVLVEVIDLDRLAEFGED